jgi:hypothetical protein
MPNPGNKVFCDDGTTPIDNTSSSQTVPDFKVPASGKVMSRLEMAQQSARKASAAREITQVNADVKQPAKAAVENWYSDDSDDIRGDSYISDPEAAEVREQSCSATTTEAVVISTDGTPTL